MSFLSFGGPFSTEAMIMGETIIYNHHLHPVFFWGGPFPLVEAVALMASSSKWQEGIECCREFGSPEQWSKPRAISGC